MLSPSSSFHDDEEIQQQHQQETIVGETSLNPLPCFDTTADYNERNINSSNSRSNNSRRRYARSVTLDWTCMAAMVVFLLLCLGHTTLRFGSSSISGGEGRRLPHALVLPSAMNHHEQVVQTLSESSAMAYRTVPHSLQDMNQVLYKTLGENNPTLMIENAKAEREGERHLDDSCVVRMTIDTICEGCDEWIAESGLQDYPWCHTELTSMTFHYTGCPCGSLYSIDYENSVWSNASGQTSLQYECWMPHSSTNATDSNEAMIPDEIRCQDYTDSQNSAVQWVATSAEDLTIILGSGTVEIGQEYSVSSSNPSTLLPPFINVTFYDMATGVALQSTVFPSAYCPGYPDAWYRERYSQMHIVEARTETSVVDTRDTLKEALWINVTISTDAGSPPVVLQELTLVANINSEAINLTDDVYGVTLSNDNDWVMVNSERNQRTIRGRNSIYSTSHSRLEPKSNKRSMNVLVGPMTVDLYWRTRTTFFGTIIARSVPEDSSTTIAATQTVDTNRECNGFHFHEYITGMQ